MHKTNLFYAYALICFINANLFYAYLFYALNFISKKVFFSQICLRSHKSSNINVSDSF